MKKILFTVLILLLVVTPVLAEPTGNGNNSGTTTQGSDNAVLAREKRVTIKTQAQELVQLRQQLKTKIQEKKQIVNQYREQSKLTTTQREEIKAMIQNMTNVQEKLNSAYQNAIKAMNNYKGDSSTNKVTGLDLVISSQQERIRLLQEAISALE